KHLNPRVSTIHETLERAGSRSGSTNLLLPRGPVKHRTPLFELTLTGPRLLAVGPVLSERESGGETFLIANSIRDPDVWRIARRWLHRKPSPDFLIAYLSDLDKKVHREGPSHRQHLLEIDRRLSALLSSFGSWEQALDRYIFILMGDSGHVPVKEDKGHQIHLEEVLKGLRLLPPGSRLQPDECDWVVAPNEQLAILYPVRPSVPTQPVQKRLLKHPGIDLVVKRDGKMITVHSRRGVLRFRRGGLWSDPYGTSWTFSGNPEVLDLQIDPAKKSIGYRSYPDAFRQLLGAAGAQRSPCLLVTARAGYEFRYGTSPSHPGGGSHGSLKRREMLVPLIAGGTSVTPAHRRIVDLKA
ncbi:MAG: alkaline phosphatase family protein, partial [Planifilum fulgidum]